ncbi:MAG: hypothetical protein PHD51_01465 [Patescibacteria group bacterium]|nr:hypothetical protein [Patescibacteria group bacterium]MDD5490470.1 hypothetical protein [Patescibacteria group bacterium]
MDKNGWESSLDPKKEEEKKAYIDTIRQRSKELLSQIPDEQLEFILNILQGGKTIKEIEKDKDIEAEFMTRFNLRDDKNFRQIANIISTLKFANREDERLNKI